MKICIVSDSHDRAEPLAAAVKQAQTAGAQAVIHCGDLIGANMKQIRDIVDQPMTTAPDDRHALPVVPGQRRGLPVRDQQEEGHHAGHAGGYYSQLLTVAYGGNLKEAGLDGHVIQPEKLKQIAERKK